MKKFALIALLLLTEFANAQVNINDYKYVIVPARFDFQSEPDKYQLNSLLKAYLENKGFTVFMDNQNFPSDLAMNNCLALKALVTNQSNMFNSKTNFELVNCNNQVAFKSETGESRSKDFRQSYQESLRNALKSFDKIEYAYNPNAQSVNNTVPGSYTVVQQQVQPQQQVVVQTPVTPAPKPVVTMVESASLDFTSQGEDFMLKANGKDFEIFKRALVDDVVTYGMVGTLKATGQPGIYLATFKKQTSLGYFDEKGNLKIEGPEGGEARVFTKK